jgi:hypothetical protein
VDGKEILPRVMLPTHKTPVTIIRQKGESMLVQYLRDGVTTRCTVPVAQIAGGTVADQVLAAGIPYGFPWEDIQLTFDMQKFSNELHQVDIWTAEDLLKSPQKLWSALRAALADQLSQVLDIARNETRRSKQNG